MREHRNIDPNEYPNISDVTWFTERISEYIWMPHINQTNIRIYSYPGNDTNTNTNNIQGPFYLNILITDYSNFEKRLNDAVFYVNFYTWCLFDARITFIFSLFIKHRQENIINIWKYSYFYEYTNKFPNILGRPKIYE